MQRLKSSLVFTKTVFQQVSQAGSGFVGQPRIIFSREGIMATYFIVEVLQIKDEAMYKRYADAAQPIIEKHQGEYMIRSNDVTLVSGTSKPERVILIRFPNDQALKECFDSAEYREISPLRLQSTESRAFFIHQRQAATQR
jgi:uncharacterized protein (DUF1330 family)